MHRRPGLLIMATRASNKTILWIFFDIFSVRERVVSFICICIKCITSYRIWLSVLHLGWFHINILHLRSNCTAFARERISARTNFDFMVCQTFMADFKSIFFAILIKKQGKNAIWPNFTRWLRCSFEQSLLNYWGKHLCFNSFPIFFQVAIFTSLSVVNKWF